MTKSNRDMKARAGIAAAVLVGGAAVGVTAVAASGHSTSASAQSAGYSMSAGSSAPMSTAMSSAMSSALTSLQDGRQGKALTSMASMASMKNFAQAQHHGTTVAVQRGVVELATKRFLLVKSANGQQHLWWVRGSKIVNATPSTTAMTTMPGSTGSASAMTAPTAKPATITVSADGQTITIIIRGSAATVSAPAGTPAAASSASAMPSSAASGQTVKSTQSAFAASNGLKRGDLAFVAGVREHGLLIAKLVLFAGPTTTATPAPSTSTGSTTGTGAVTGTHS